MTMRTTSINARRHSRGHVVTVPQEITTHGAASRQRQTGRWAVLVAAVVLAASVVPGAEEAAASPPAFGHAPAQPSGSHMLPMVSEADDEQTVEWSVAPLVGDDGRPRTRFTYTAERGERIRDAVVVTNLSAETLDLRVYAADGVTTAEGEFTVLPVSDPTHGVGAWLVPEANQVILDPGQQAEVPFEIIIPADARPGDHAGGIVASRLTIVDDGDGAGMTLDQRVGARVYVRVPGEAAPKLEIRNLRLTYDSPWFPFDNQPAVATFDLVNSGNITLGVNMEASLTGPFGMGLGTGATADLPTVLPGSVIPCTMSIDGALPVGHVALRVDAVGVDLGDFDDATAMPSASAEDRRVAVPWLVVGVLVLFVIWLVWVRRRRSRLKQRPQESVEPDPVLQ